MQYVKYIWYIYIFHIYVLLIYKCTTCIWRQYELWWRDGCHFLLRHTHFVPCFWDSIVWSLCQREQELVLEAFPQRETNLAGGWTSVASDHQIRSLLFPCSVSRPCLCLSASAPPPPPSTSLLYTCLTCLTASFVISNHSLCERLWQTGVLAASVWCWELGFPAE